MGIKRRMEERKSAYAGFLLTLFPIEKASMDIQELLHGGEDTREGDVATYVHARMLAYSLTYV